MTSSSRGGGGGEPGTKEYCLRWNHHQPNFVQFFGSLFVAESLVDVTLVSAEGQKLLCHKLILAASSSYFQHIFENNPCKHPIVILKDVLHADLKIILNFIYNGEVNISENRIGEFLSTAATLQVKGLAEIPAEELRKLGRRTSTPPPPPHSTHLPPTKSQSVQHSNSQEEFHESPRKRLRKSSSMQNGEQSSGGSFESGMGASMSRSIDDGYMGSGGEVLSPFKTSHNNLGKSRSLDAEALNVDSDQSSCGEQHASFDATTSERSSKDRKVFRRRPLLARQRRIKRDDGGRSGHDSESSCGDDGSQESTERPSSAPNLLATSKEPSIETPGGSNMSVLVKTTSPRPSPSTSPLPIVTVSHSSPTPPSSPSPLLHLHHPSPIQIKIQEDPQSLYTSRCITQSFSQQSLTITERNSSAPPTTTPSSQAGLTPSLLSVPGFNLVQERTSRGVLIKQHSQPLLPSSSGGGGGGGGGREGIDVEAGHTSSNHHHHVIRRQHSQPNPTYHLTIPQQQQRLISYHHQQHSVPTPREVRQQSPGTLFQIIPTTSSSTELKRNERAESMSISGAPPASYYLELTPNPPQNQNQGVTITPVTLPTSSSSTSSSTSLSATHHHHSHSHTHIRSLSSQEHGGDSGIFSSSSSSLDSQEDSSTTVTLPSSLSVDEGNSSVKSCRPQVRSVHCPALRPGPALGCNYCWNSVDDCGRILRRKTKYQCPDCSINLCIVPCFQEYHEKMSKKKRVKAKLGLPKPSSM